MAPETPLSFPVIDLTKPEALKPGTPEWDSAKVQVREALEEYGCFKTIYNGLQPELRKALWGAMEDLFDLPKDVKKLNVYEKPLHSFLEHIPHFEGMGVDCPDVFEDVEKFTNTLWPEGNPNFSKTVHSVTRQVAELDGIIRRMILESLGIEKYLEEHMDSTTYLLRLFKYFPPQSSDGPDTGLRPHTDKAIGTLLLENDIDALEVRTKQGDWIRVGMSEGSFVFMAGDSLHAWSNGRFYNAIHRVSMRPGSETRYSAALFSIPKESYTVKAPEELVDQHHPLLFKPFNYFEYSKFLTTQLNLSSGNPIAVTIQDYCGI